MATKPLPINFGARVPYVVVGAACVQGRKNDSLEIAVVEGTVGELWSVRGESNRRLILGKAKSES